MTVSGLGPISCVNRVPGGLLLFDERARILGFIADGSLSGKLLAFLGVELGFAILATIALLRLDG